MKKGHTFLKRIYIASPLRGTPDPDPVVQAQKVARNIDVARLLCKFAARDGVAPFAPHLLYTQFLDDAVQSDRVLGIRAGLSFLSTCAEMWVFTKLGISEGMKIEIAAAQGLGKPVIYDPQCWGNMP